MIQLEGRIASPGFAQAPAFLLPNHDSPFRIDLSQDDDATTSHIDCNNELQRLAQAREQVVHHFEEVQRTATRILSPQQAQVFESHKMLLYDVAFYARIEKEIARGPHTAEDALTRALRIYDGFVQSTAHESFQLKLNDLQDVWRQVMSCLRTGELIPPVNPQHEVILVARTFYPSQFAHLPLHLIKGLVTQEGAPESTTAALAKALHIPYFCGVTHIQQIEEGMPLVLDGTAGLLLLSPQPQIAEAYNHLSHQWHNQSLQQKQELQQLPGETRCGQSIALRVDIHAMADLEVALQSGASGIGDVCTASLFIERGWLPSQAEQVQLYQYFIEQIRPSRVAFRTLDLSHTRQLQEISMPQEHNPFLGWRGIRPALANRSLFLTQLIALLLASENHPIRIVLPMVTTTEEVDDVSLMLDEAFQIIQAHEPGRMTQYQLGISIETMAAALQLDLFGSKIDFISVDTDALLQMVTASGRGNPRLLHLLSPMQPSFLRFLHQLYEHAQQTGIELLVRGSMASEPLCIPFLLGLGFREYSIAPHMLPKIKKRLRRISIEDATQLAHDALRQRTLQANINLAHQFLEALPPAGPEANAQYVQDLSTARAQARDAISGNSPSPLSDVTARET